MQVFVGTFNENDLKEGKDKKAVAEMKEKTGLRYTNSKLVIKNGVPVGLKLWVCTLDKMVL